MPSIAQSLKGKKVDHLSIPKHELVTRYRLYYKFEDDSEAYILTKFEKTAPFLTASLSTSCNKHVEYWETE